jgi:hypothetical protein
MWRFAHNSLPLLMNIKRRGMECETLCVCCRKLNEDGAHLFLKCKKVREIWVSLGLETVCDRMSTYQSAAAVVQEMLKLDDNEKATVCCLLWRWWLRRNKLNKEGNAISLAELSGQIKYWAVESMLYSRGDKKENTVPRLQSWSKPVGDVLKINCDGSFQEARRSGGWGFVVRDSVGTVRGAGAGAIKYAASAIQTEAIACAEAASAAAEWGMGHVYCSR